MFVVKFNLRSKESKDNDSPFIFGSFHFETLNFPIRESHPTHFITFPYPMIHQPVMIGILSSREFQMERRGFCLKSSVDGGGEGVKV